MALEANSGYIHDFVASVSISNFDLYSGNINGKRFILSSLYLNDMCTSLLVYETILPEFIMIILQTKLCYR